MPNKFIQIGKEVINLESIDYVNLKQGQKSQEDETPMYVLTCVLKSGVQISIPFEDENACNYVHKVLKDKLGCTQITIPTLKKK